MGDAKRRKLLGIESETAALLRQIEQVPQVWSIACTIGIGNQLALTLCQDDAEVLQAQFLQATDQPATILKRIEKQGLLVVVHPIRLEQLALLRPDAVHTHLKNTVRAGALRRFQRTLAIAPYGDAPALEKLLELWREAQTS
ncbi:hypothetical protein IQ268_17070 [Oculatella sp. LEGE 06141]|uniref:hypothetical protein n=1 Tax=Oculatella sp. LEGE 06141 TaxID=1828648 RepID=UPI00187F8AFE|nr:hypothetical protein [Oculatella sp. LEGE 06141]MBE9180275.1 hypothetical protein [Oculatella sp. LEGE 06141]